MRNTLCAAGLLTGVESYTQKVVLGAVILGAVLLDMLKKRRST